MRRDEIRHSAATVAQGAGRDTAGGPAGAAEDATRRTVRSGTISMLVAAAVLLVFNSAGLRTWAHGLPGNAATDVLVESADAWHGMMTRAGVATAAALVRSAVAELRSQPWPDDHTPSIGKADIAKDNR